MSFKKLDKGVKLVGGGSVINGAYHVYFLHFGDLFMEYETVILHHKFH